MNKKKTGKPSARRGSEVANASAFQFSDLEKPTELRLSEEELMPLVCEYFCGGKTPSEIVRIMLEKHGLEITREMPYKLVNYAARQNWLRFTPPAHDILSDRIADDYPFLRGVDVVHAVGKESVADRAAKLVLDLIRQKTAAGKREIHLGFSGGQSMALLVRKLSVMLTQEIRGLPDTLVCHSLVSGFDPDYPQTSPIAFLSYLIANPALRVETKFVGFPAPPIVEVSQRAEILRLPGVREAREVLHRLDLILTSGAGLSDEHSMLQKYYRRYSEPTVDFLVERGCVGDMLWLPVCADQPFRFDRLNRDEKQRLRYRSMTLVELHELPELIEGGTSVVLALGPCQICFKDRADILRAVLNQQSHLITHLVVDSKTVQRLLRD